MDILYQRLGLDRCATRSMIRRGYRVMAMKHHPDKGGDADSFVQLNDAYNTLLDTKSRSRYDDEFESVASLFHPEDTDPFYLVETTPTTRSVSFALDEIRADGEVLVRISRDVVNEQKLVRCRSCCGTGVLYVFPNGLGHAPCIHCTSGYESASIEISTIEEQVRCIVPSACVTPVMFRFTGKGHQTVGAAPADLILYIHVK